MKQFITVLLANVLVQLVNATICYFVYRWFDLVSIFGTEVTFTQWLAISTIVTTLVVIPKQTNLKSNDSKGLKVPSDVLKNGL